MDGKKKEIMEVLHKTEQSSNTNFCRELHLQSMNYSVSINSNVREENIEFLANVGLSLIKEMKLLEEKRGD